ncbi:MAG TPA: bifunctional diguanylate cyclase/phosphodiesterase [Candidatus Dormibacteraeota bacterium]|nr:bifunctional diguanylate cyclase/phosphodiesterase [Candidatus Dormibacteraeota bacterium]
MSTVAEAHNRRTTRLPWRSRAAAVEMLPGEQRLPFVVAPSPRARRFNRVRLSVLALAALCLGALAIGMLTTPHQSAFSRVDLSREQWAMIIGAFTVAALTIRHLVARLQEAVAQVEQLSRTDQLTGASNRWAWDEELPREMARSRRDGSAMVVAVLDLDRFDAFNQLRGHPEGDRLLQRMAATWTDVLRDTDTLARYDGAQFAVLLRQCWVEHAVAIVERLRMVVPEDQTVSVGIAAWNGRDTSLELMRRAEEALISAKVGGRDRVRIAETGAPVLPADATKWNAVVQQLLDDRSVVAAYQPIVDLRAGSIVAYEALARPNREKIDISVERMFSSAQRMGLGRDLDWLCRRAALAGATWVPSGVPVFVNCNLSGLVDPVHRVDQMLLVMEAAGRDPRDVVLEITERELVGDLSRLKIVVSAYRREGFRFAVDDVGEGHSTLEVLAATSPDFIKVARSLVIDAASPGPRAAVRAVVAFAEELGASTIAEGIETESTALFMRELGVHLGQGWLFGRPELPPSGAPRSVLSDVVPNGR